MRKALKASILIWLLLNILSCQGQTEEQKTQLSDDFDRHPPIYYGMSDVISARDTSPGWSLDGQQIVLTGIVYENDGKTPVANILMYYYQTNLAGKYIDLKNEKRSMPANRLGQTHGYIRGWVRTDMDGRYEIYTVRPGSYPGRDEPAHIHMYIKEPFIDDPYYIDDFVFDDDKLLTSKKRMRLKNRGGSGVLRMVRKNTVLVGERNIILGLNIPDYAKKKRN